MGNSGWTADPDDLLVPGNASDLEPRIFIGGNNDPIIAALGQTEGIVFYFSEQRAFMLSVEQDGTGVPPSDYGRFHLWAYSGFPAIFRQIIDVDFVIPLNSVTVSVFGDANSDQLSTLRLGGTGVYIGDYAEPASTDFPQDAYVYGIPLARGVKAAAASVASSAAIAAETVVLSTPSKTYRAGRVYEAELVGLVNGSAASASGSFRLRKGTTVAGAILSTTGDTDCSVVGRNYNAYGKTFFQVVGADVTTALCYCLTGLGGNIVHFASATTPRYMVVRDVTDTAQGIAAPILS
jgi:hypothetical protein